MDEAGLGVNIVHKCLIKFFVEFLFNFLVYFRARFSFQFVNKRILVWSGVYHIYHNI